MAEFEFVAHARDRLQERLINVEEVIGVLSNPMAIYLDLVTEYFIALGARTLRRGHWLLVVYEVRDDVRRIISVLDTTRAEEIAKSREAKGRWLKVR